MEQKPTYNCTKTWSSQESIDIDNAKDRIHEFLKTLKCAYSQEDLVIAKALISLANERVEEETFKLIFEDTLYANDKLRKIELLNEIKLECES